MAVRTTASAQQLAEFLAAVSSSPDAPTAVRSALERAAEAVEADVAAAVTGGEVTVAVGLPPRELPTGAVVAIADGEARPLDVPALGPCRAIVLSVEDTPPSKLVLCRAGEDGFSREEESLLRGMARVLELSLNSLRLLERERALRARSEAQAAENARLLADRQHRQMLLERLSKIQRSIVDRADPQEVLNSIVSGACELVGDEIATLRLTDPNDPSQLVLVASHGIDKRLRAGIERRPVSEGAAGRALSEGGLVVVEDYPRHPNADPALAASRVQSAIATPVHEKGVAVGSLAVGSHRPGRTYSSTEQEMLIAFAEHASIALTDAKIVADALHQATHDSLTGLPNRALFADRLAESLARAERLGSPVGMLFLDLDGFKTINDGLGHAVGDDLLVAVGQRLRDCIRGGDVAVRFGGDEFGLLLEGINDASGAARVAERILAAMRQPFELAGRSISIGASIGVAVGRSRQDDLIRDADLAMYKAKAGGKNRYELYEPHLHAAVVERLELEADLRHAVERDELLLHYQPLVDLATGQVVGAEALVRWQHPERGMLGPVQFVPLAEESGLIVPVGAWVLREACRQAAEWHASGHPLMVAVNLSGAQLEAPGLAADLAAALEETGLHPASVMLEITETVLMHDLEATVARLDELKRLGVLLSVDDFGTGYSSLQYLRRFPLDLLKLAKPFVDRVEDAGDGYALARAIIDLGHNLDLTVLAEGIEGPEQRELLTRLGCRLGQGYHFARPTTSEALDAVLGGSLPPLAREPAPVAG